MTEQVIDIQQKMSVIILLNKERVIYEVIELSRLKISVALGILESQIGAHCNLTSEGKFQIKFVIKEEAVKSLDAEKMKTVVNREYQIAWKRLQERLAGLGAMREIC